MAENQQCFQKKAPGGKPNDKDEQGGFSMSGVSRPDIGGVLQKSRNLLKNIQKQNEVHVPGPKSHCRYCTNHDDPETGKHTDQCCHGKSCATKPVVRGGG